MTKKSAMKTVYSGTPTTATLQLSDKASGPALLFIGHAPSTGQAQVKAASVAPGATTSVKISPGGFGIMHVLVAMDQESDSGQLTVDPPGPTDKSIQGDTHWRYGVVTS